MPSVTTPAQSISASLRPCRFEQNHTSTTASTAATGHADEHRAEAEVAKASPAAQNGASTPAMPPLTEVKNGHQLGITGLFGHLRVQHDKAHRAQPASNALHDAAYHEHGRLARRRSRCSRWR